MALVDALSQFTDSVAFIVKLYLSHLIMSIDNDGQSNLFVWKWK